MMVNCNVENKSNQIIYVMMENCNVENKSNFVCNKIENFKILSFALQIDDIHCSFLYFDSRSAVAFSM